MLCQPCVVAVGDGSVAVVRRDDGELVAELALSSLSSPLSPSVCASVLSVVCGDTGADGYSDVVLYCDSEYVVLSLSVHRGSSLFPRLLLGLLCALLAAVCAQLAILHSPALRVHVHRMEHTMSKRPAHAE